MSELFDIELPISVAFKVLKIVHEKKCTIDEAIFILVEKVCTPTVCQ